MGTTAKLARKLLSAKFCSPKFGFCRHYAILPSSNVGHGDNNISVSSSQNGTYLQLQNPLWSSPLLLHSTWLRDHCRCPQCYNEQTHHKKVDIAKAGLNITPKITELEDHRLNITWPDGHKSVYNVDWLWENVYDGHYKDACRAKKHLWGGGLDSIVIKDNIVEYADYMNSEEAVKTALKCLVQYGFAIVKNVPQNAGSTQKAAERICPLRLGFFGKIMEFQSDMLHTKPFSHKQSMTPHTDQSYLTEPAGVKVVRCIDTDARMRINLVDGFNIAEQLKKNHNEAYRTLSELPLLFEYTDDTFRHKCPDVILKHDALTGTLIQIKYNMYYRSTLSTMPFEDMDRFYSAVHILSQLVQNTFQYCRFQPVPGTLMFIDNWRVLFSTSMASNSKMEGCYLGWSDYMSEARRLAIVP